MARATKADSAEQLSTTVGDATAAAAERVLRLTAEAGHGRDKGAKAATIARLARICEEAADHMASAHRLLFDGHEGGEAALDHLDAALRCLKQVEVEGANQRSEQDREAV